MDRHICRAKRIDNNEWVYGYYVHCDGKINHGKTFVLPMVTSIWYKDYEISIDGFIEVDPNTVCQCTGWCDSNKTPIFEKDIVEFVGPSIHRDLIWWNNEMSQMEAIPVEGIKFNRFDYWNPRYPKANYSTFCLMM